MGDEVVVGGYGGLLLGLHLGEQKHILDALRAGHHHHQAVDADAHAGGGGHAVLEGADKVEVDEHGLVVAFLAEAQLLLETAQLVDGVVELGVGVGQLLAADEELETLGELGIVAVALAEGRHLDGVVGNEGGLDELVLALLAEDGVDELALAHGGVGLHAEALAGLAEFLLAHAADVDTGLLLDELAHGGAAERGLEVDVVAPDVDLRGTVESQGDALEHVLGEGHHPVVVLVGHIDFHGGELGVVGAVHALVAEVAAELIHTGEATDYQTLEVELVGNAEIEVDVQRVVVRDEGARGGTAGDALQHGGVHLEVALLVEVTAHLVHYLGTLHKGVADMGVDDEVDVALAVAQLGVAEGVVDHAVLLLDDGQGAQALAEHGEALHMDGGLTHLGNKHIARYADNVADVEQALEDGIVEGLVLPGAYLVALDVELDATRVVLQLDKGGGAHDAAAHDAAGEADVLEERVVLGVALKDVGGGGVDLVEGGGIGVDAEGFELGERISSDLFLF